MGRWILFVLAVACLGLVAGDVRADLGGFVITDFDVELTVSPDSELLVAERIVVDFSEPRRGIYRTIPVRYTDPFGYAYSLGFRLQDVLDENGNEHRTKVSNQGRYVRIRIGDPDRTLTGRVTYLIRYRIADGLGHFSEHDEVYWNATGHEWRTTVERASATVRLPGPFTADSLETGAFAGPFGSRNDNVRITYPEPGVVRYESLGPLGPMEGLTVVAAFPRGYVRFPGFLSRLGRFLGDNWILVSPFLALGFLVRRYRRRGRDPEGPASVVVRYEPPEGMTPGEIGALVDESVDLRDLTATVVDLAVRGYLEIRMDQRSLFLGIGKREVPVFVRTAKDRAGLAEHERKLLEGLFATGHEVEPKDLKNKFYRHIPKIKDALFDRLTNRGYFAEKPSSVKGRYMAGGFGLGVLIFVVGFLVALARGGVMPNAALVPIAAAVPTFILFVAFSPAMPRRTKQGVQLRAWARGFEEFVERVESEQLEADRRRNVFEALLPYAMALGVAEKWAERFEGIYAEGGPGWYTGTHFHSGFSTSAMNDSLSSAMGSVGQSMAAAPRSSSSSGSGGGGFSGGGGGGGGGGSW